MLNRCFLVLILFGSIYSEDQVFIPPNPCPEVLNYYYDLDGTIFAEIKVPNDGSKVFKMEVNASYVGIFTEQNRPKLKLDLTTPKDDLLDARQLTYKLSFTRQESVPRITQVKFNGGIYCRGPSAPLTNAGLSDMWVFKETRLQMFTYYTDETPRPMSKPAKPTMPPFIPPRSTTPYPWLKPDVITEVFESPIYPEPIIKLPQNDLECGVGGTPKLVNLITDGNQVTTNEFPWLVALYQWKDLNYEFRCTANLIDRNHVLTVASCLQFYRASLVKTEDILLVFGSSNLKQWAGRQGIEVRKVASVESSPEYQQYSSQGDVAVLKLEQPVQFTDSIRPICLPSERTNIHSMMGKYGTVSGWGKDDHQMQYMADAKKIQMPVISRMQCAESNRDIWKILSEKSFCAGERNGKGPCTGDIGSPFMEEVNGKWYLLGLVSQAIVDRRTAKCKLDEYIVFTDMAKYTGWISKILNKS